MKDREYKQTDYPHKELTSRIICAAIEVHKVLVPGYVESVYERALARELNLQNIAYKQQMTVKVAYKGITAGTHRLDFLVEDIVVVKIKAVACLLEVHEGQIVSSMKSARAKLGLLVNFATPRLIDDLKRFIL